MLGYDCDALRAEDLARARRNSRVPRSRPSFGLGRGFSFIYWNAHPTKRRLNGAPQVWFVSSFRVGHPPHQTVGCAEADGDNPHFWQARYYDFNVWTRKKRIEKLKYIHRNPVKRGLVEKPEDWRWSSCRNYATGEEGVVEVESTGDGEKTGTHGSHGV